MSSKVKPESKPLPVSTITPLEEGLFYEKVFGPNKVEVRYIDPENPKRKIIKLIDANGRFIELTNSHAINRFYSYVMQPLKMTKGELSEMDPVDAAQLFTDHFQKRQSDDKPHRLKFLFDGAKECVAVVSEMHKQISWTKIRDVIGEAIHQVYGEVQEGGQVGDTWAYKMPIDNKYVSLWAMVDPGNNVIKGRSGIRVSTKMRTEFDTSSGGVGAPCMNWCNLWQEPLKMFNIPAVRIANLVRVERDNLTETPTVIPGLYTFDIHVQDTELNPDLFIDRLRTLKEVAESTVIKVIVEGSIETKLTRDEMDDLLHCYMIKANLPAYIVNGIRNALDEKTIWGLAQAVSYVRTHEELRGKKEWIMRRKLENIAGEVLSLAPTIQRFHEEQGPLTFEKLMGKPKPKEAPPITIKGGGTVRE